MGGLPPGFILMANKAAIVGCHDVMIFRCTMQ
jgi:hypothetical protein